MFDTSVFSPFSPLAILYFVVALGTIILIFSRAAALGGLPARIYLLNLAHCLLLVASAVGQGNVASRWCLVGAVVGCALTGAQLAVERWGNYKSA